MRSITVTAPLDIDYFSELLVLSKLLDSDIIPVNFLGCGCDSLLELLTNFLALLSRWYLFVSVCDELTVHLYKRNSDGHFVSLNVS